MSGLLVRLLPLQICIYRTEEAVQNVATVESKVTFYMVVNQPVRK